MAGILDSIHQHYVYGRRLRVLSGHLAPLLPPNGHVLDVGCGDGALSGAILRRRPDLHIQGLEVLLRGQPQIPVSSFDGQTLPLADQSVDTVMFADVLHHADDPARLLREAARVAVQSVVIKDHVAQGILAWSTLRFLDRVGNTRHGVALPYNYWTSDEWSAQLLRVGFSAVTWKTALHLYPWPASLCFDRCLHFVAELKRMEADRK
jgi:ubiquinone/menaquinone biosynthesis C-methylase UbiE